MLAPQEKASANSCELDRVPSTLSVWGEKTDNGIHGVTPHSIYLKAEGDNELCALCRLCAQRVMACIMNVIRDT